MKKIINFVLKSSADPKKYSLTVKMVLLGTIPYVMQVLGIVCALGLSCTVFDQTLLERFAAGVAEFVFLALSLVSVIGVVYGLLRKIKLTLMGENLTLK